jgi:hypothetical protein
MNVEPLAIIGNDPCRLLPTVLQGVQPKGGMGTGVGVGIDAKNATFIVEFIKRHDQTFPLGITGQNYRLGNPQPAQQVRAFW